uniref:Cell cycle associated protein 1b n=1 Tax=Gasterosteus aculeatus aculeatus TaxID=481459 RepID=G3P610_GASAC
MPSAMNANRTVQSASPDVGSAPGSMGNFALGGQAEVLKQVLCVLDKKVRNLEKKKSKLDDYQVKKDKGERLNQDQLDALTKFQEITYNLEFGRELQKTFITLGQDIQKVVKKSARREQLQREEAEQRRLKTILELQFLLDRLGEDNVRRDLKEGVGGSPMLTDAHLAAFDEFYKLVGPDRDQSVRLVDRYEEASVHLWDLLEGKNKAVVGTTYKALRETLDQVMLSGYFDQVPSHQNGVCEEKAAEEAEAQDQASAATVAEAAAAPAVVAESSEFINRQFIPDGTYSGSEKEQGDEWATETEVGCRGPSPPPVQPAASPVAPETHPLNLVSPVPPTDPLVRKQVVQDLMAQMQGMYNFMQDSMLEFDGPIDPAIVSSQPMKPAQNMDLPQMVCPPAHPESRPSQPKTVPVQPDTTQVSIVSPTPPPMYQTSHTPDPRPSTETIDPIQVNILLCERLCTSSSSEQPSAAHPPVFQPGSKAPHSSGINVNAAPFQSMQTVFNLNAPVPPANETEALNQASQYQNSYNQAFSSQPQHPVEQTEMQPEPLQSVVGAFHSQDQSGGHQQPPQQGPGFGRQGQSFYNSRGMSRGGPRNARGMINGYRGSSNGFRGGYDGYRPPFANTPNSGYGQTQFNTPRDYSNGNYQRDGYQPNYKRGAGQGPRGVSRGSTQAIRS